MTKNVFYTLLGASVMLAGITACNRASAPKEVQHAYVSAGISGGTTRALFVGGTTQDSPSKIKWGKVGDKLPMLIYYPATTKTVATESNLELKGDYKGTLTVPYEEANVNNQKVQYFATSGPNAAAFKGAYFEAGSYTQDNKVTLNTALPHNGTVDMTDPNVEWPLISQPNESNPLALWSTVHTKSGGGVNFNLFGNMFLIHFENVLEDDGYDANSNDTNEAYLPQIVIESNGMAFAGSEFVKEVNSNEVGGGIRAARGEFSLKKLNFSAGAKQQVLPIWFRPYKPTDGKDFYITITWRVYNKDLNKWEESVRKLRPNVAMNPTNGTIFSENDGRYYRLKGGVSPKIGAEFGSNSFFIVEAELPSFD